MKADVFRGPGQFGIEEKQIPVAGPGEVIVKVQLTTICGTDIHIIRGEYPVQPGLTIGHEEKRSTMRQQWWSWTLTLVVPVLL